VKNEIVERIININIDKMKDFIVIILYTFGGLPGRLLRTFLSTHCTGILIFN